MKWLVSFGVRSIPFVIIIAAMVLTGLWSLEPVRLWMLDELDKRDLQRVEAALDDPSDRVAARACAHAMQNGQGSPPQHMMEVLVQRPNVAFGCLEQVAEAETDTETADQKGDDEAKSAEPADPSDAETSSAPDEPAFNPFVTRDIELVPRHELIASKLGKRWMAELIEGEANSCQTAQNARRAMEHARLDATYRLTSCAIAADAEQVRQCCIEELGGPDAFAQIMDHPDAVPLRQARDDYSALVGASFPSVPIASSLDAPDESGKEDEADQDSKDPDSKDPDKETSGERFGDKQIAVQDWVVDVGCRLHASDPSDRQTVESFVPLIESDGCAPSDPPWQGYYSEMSWAAMCGGMYSYRRAELDMSPREAVCDSLERASLAQASTATQLSVAAAIGVASQVGGVGGRDYVVVNANDSQSKTFRTSQGLSRSRSSSRGSRVLRSLMGQIIGR